MPGGPRPAVWARRGAAALALATTTATFLPASAQLPAVNFESEQERDEYLESLGEQISSYGGCRSQCQ